MTEVRDLRSHWNRATISGIVLWMAGATLIAVGLFADLHKVAAQVPSKVTDEDLEKLRHRLDEMALRRVSGPDEELPWDMDASAEIGELRAKEAVVKLSSESYKLGCIWIFRNLSDPKEPVVRACIYHQGADYLVLQPGEYEVTLHAGRAEDVSIALKPRRVELRRSTVYRSEFSLRVEDLVARRIKTILDEEQNDEEDGL